MTPRMFFRRSFIVCGSLIAVAGYWGLANLQITLNGSSSLPETAYLQWHWPQILWHGAVVAIEPPAVFHGRLDGMAVVKRLEGMPGDRIDHQGHSVCVVDRCYGPLVEEGEPFAPLLAEGEIPEGKVALFGDAPNSFDSRYASFGLISVEDIQAVGIALDGFPHWTEVAAWLGLPQ